MTGATTTFSPGAGNTLTLNGTIADDSANSLPTGQSYTAGTAAGAAIAATSGTVVLTNAGNTYAGGTTVSGGAVVNFNSAGNFGSGQITLNGGGLQWATGTTTDISSQLAAIGSNGASFDTNGNSVTFGTGLSGSGGVTKLGAGTLTFSVANSYMGGTTVSGGTLALSGSGNLGANSNAVTVSGGTLDLGTFTIIQNAGVHLTGGTIQNGTLASSAGFDLQSGTVSDGVVRHRGGDQDHGWHGHAVGRQRLSRQHDGQRRHAGNHRRRHTRRHQLADDGVGRHPRSRRHHPDPVGAQPFRRHAAERFPQRTDQLETAARSTASAAAQARPPAAAPRSSSGPTPIPGATTVNGGTLEVNGSITGTSSVAVNAGGTLTGTGLVDPLTVTFASGSTFAPGTVGMPGTSMTITGNLVLQSGANIRSTFNPTTSSFAAVDGTATLTGATATKNFPRRQLRFQDSTPS